MRHHPNVVVRHNVVCQSDRLHGAKPHLIVIHDTEGANIPHSIRDLQGLADYFDRQATQASAHVATDADGNSARMVDDNRKAWHAAAVNSYSLGMENIGFTTTKWGDPQLQEMARWVALWNKRYRIPIRSVSHPNTPGVIQHRSLGLIGGGHHDISSTFPMARMLGMAREHRKHI